MLLCTCLKGHSRIHIIALHKNLGAQNSFKVLSILLWVHCLADLGLEDLVNGSISLK